MTNVLPMKGFREAPKKARSRMETVLITISGLDEWAKPPFQRPLRVNDKVRAIAEVIRADPVIPSIVTLGQIEGQKTLYVIDGQHRIEAARLAGAPEFIVDVCIKTFDNMAEMGAEYVQLNSQIARMNPDDTIRGLELSYPPIKYVRKECPFVGYDHIRRNTTGSALLSMSAALRCWSSASRETPSGTTNGQSSLQMAQELTQTEAEGLCRFLTLARAAWGADQSNFRLWGNLNLTMCMWLYHQVVLNQERGIKRAVVLTNDQFKKCLMLVSATQDYNDWLLGRVLGERDRMPCYNRLKAIFVKRLREDARDPQRKVLLPQPSWAS